MSPIKELRKIDESLAAYAGWPKEAKDWSAVEKVSFLIKTVELAERTVQRMVIKEERTWVS